MMAVVYALGIRDLHFENLIVSSGFPVPIDVEVIANKDFNEVASLADTGLVGADGTDALKGGGNVFKLDIFDVTKENGDYSIKYWNKAYKGQNRVAYLEGDGWLDPRYYYHDISDGFSEGYLTIMCARNSISSILDKYFSEKRAVKLLSRVICRPTIVYQAALLRFFRPENGDDIEAEHHIKACLSDILRDAPKECWNGIVNAEFMDFQNCDIPYFWTRVGSRNIFHKNYGRIGKFFKGSMRERVMENLSAMCSDDLKRKRRELRRLVLGEDHEKEI
jgi:lantibiotic modifying enzyme